jgi:hypothetical protein
VAFGDSTDWKNTQSRQDGTQIVADRDFESRDINSSDLMHPCPSGRATRIFTFERRETSLLGRRGHSTPLMTQEKAYAEALRLIRKAPSARRGASAAERCGQIHVLSVVRESRNSSGSLYRCRRKRPWTRLELAIFKWLR